MDSLIGIPSAKMVNAMAFFDKDKWEVSEGNLGLSCFSIKEPSSVVSEQSDFMVLMPSARLLMLPDVDSNS